MKKITPAEKIAKKVIANMNIENSEDVHGIDPLTIILVASVILTLIRVIQECRKKRSLIKNKDDMTALMKRDIQELVLKDSWLNNLRLQRILKKELTKDQYKAYGKELQRSIMETGINLTDDEIYSLMETTK